MADRQGIWDSRGSASQRGPSVWKGGGVLNPHLSPFFMEHNQVGQASFAVAKSVLTVPVLPSCPWERDPKRGTLLEGR